MNLKSKLTYGNVIATIALFLALGGGAFAAFKAPKNSVSSKAIKKNAVKEKKIANGAVTTDKIKDGSVSGSKIASGLFFKNVVYREFVAANQATNSSQVRNIQCAAGEQAIGGGGAGTIVGTRNFPNLDVDTEILANGPINASDQAVAEGQTATGWHISLKVLAGPRDVHLYAICAQK